MNGTKEISVFVDESGSFDPDRASSRYYLICMVFHNQDVEIANQIEHLEQRFVDMGLERSHCVHAGPLVRREKEYADMNRQLRRGIFDSMMVFVRNCNIQYKCFKLDKNFIGGRQNIHDPLLQQLVQFLVLNMAEFNSYDKLKVYYDNGQKDVSALLREAFALYASKTQFVEDVTPSKYRLFQVADIICTLELGRLKLEDDGRLSVSEHLFFGGEKNFKKNFLKIIDRKAMV